jgi:hypothetical protein
MSVTKRVALSVLSFTALIGFSAISSIPAHAVTRPEPMRAAYAIVCGGDACAQTVSKTSSSADVNVWAYNKKFFGHFQLRNSQCQGVYWNSTTTTYNAGGNRYEFKNIPYQDGACGDNWQILAWQQDAPGKFTLLGTTGLSI